MSNKVEPKKYKLRTTDNGQRGTNNYTEYLKQSEYIKQIKIYFGCQIQTYPSKA